jgi:hypothetical protein
LSGSYGYLGVWVNPADPGAADDTNLNTPFVTIQHAVNTLQTALGPKPDTIFIAPGSYPETVIVWDDGINLFGFGDVVINPATGPSLVISNAGLASINAFLAGGQANYLANVGLLVSAGDGPQSNEFHNLRLEPQNALDYACVIAGAGNNTNFGNGDLGLRFFNDIFQPIDITHSTWAWLCNRLTFEECIHNGGIEQYNVSKGEYLNCEQSHQAPGAGMFLLVSYDALLDEPANGNIATTLQNCHLIQIDVNNAGQILCIESKIEDILNATDTSNLRLIESSFLGAVGIAISDTATVITNACYVDGLLSTTAGASWDGHGDEIKGGAIFAAGAGTVALDGGGIAGGITDPTAKFIWTPGLPGNIWQDSRIAWVSPNTIDSADDGLLITPFTTIQAAVDAVSPTGGQVLIAQGIYDETVVINAENVHLKGLGANLGDVIIQPTAADMPALVITSAARDAAFDVWIADPPNYETNYGDLNPSGGDASAIIEDIELQGDDTGYGTVMAGVVGACAGEFSRVASISNGGVTGMWGNTADISLEFCNFAEVHLIDSDISAFYTRLAYLAQTAGQIVDMRNCESGCRLAASDSLSMRLGATTPNPIRETHFEGDVSLSDASDLDLHGCYIGGDLEINDAATVDMDGEHIRGDVDITGTGSFYLSGVHIGRTGVSGNLTFAAGAGASVMDGGRYMGAAGGPGVAAFTRNLGL